MSHTLRNLLGFGLMVLLFSCKKEVSMEGGPVGHAVLQDSFGQCMPKNLVGTYAVGQPMTDANYLEVQVNVLTTGHYSLGTGQQNGIAFFSTGNFTQPGMTTIHLRATGTPVAEGPIQFTLSMDSSTCDFIVNILPAGSGGNGTCNATVNGTYKKNLNLSTSNTVTLQHTYAAGGVYTVSTDTLNGYYFMASVNATAGANTAITLLGAGMPVNAQMDNFTVHFGDNTSCGFSVTVQDSTTTGGSSVYFPMTQNSWWSYNDTASTDTSLVTNTGSAFISGGNYQRFVTTYSNGSPNDTSYFRKDGSANYYQYESQAQWNADNPSVPITFTQGYLEYKFLNDQLTTGATWNSDNAGMNGTNAVVLRYNFTVVDANATVVVNGVTFTNVYKVNFKVQLSSNGSAYTDLGIASDLYYAKDIGFIRSGQTPSDIFIRHWHVN